VADAPRAPRGRLPGSRFVDGVVSVFRTGDDPGPWSPPDEPMVGSSPAIWQPIECAHGLTAVVDHRIAASAGKRLAGLSASGQRGVGAPHLLNRGGGTESRPLRTTRRNLLPAVRNRSRRDDPASYQLGARGPTAVAASSRPSGPRPPAADEDQPLTVIRMFGRRTAWRTPPPSD